MGAVGLFVVINVVFLFEEGKENKYNHNNKIYYLTPQDFWTKKFFK